MPHPNTPLRGCISYPASKCSGPTWEAHAPTCRVASSCPSSRSQLNCHLLREAFPGHPIQSPSSLLSLTTPYSLRSSHLPQSVSTYQPLCLYSCVLDRKVHEGRDHLSPHHQQNSLRHNKCSIKCLNE